MLVSVLALLPSFNCVYKHFPDLKKMRIYKKKKTQHTLPLWWYQDVLILLGTTFCLVLPSMNCICKSNGFPSIRSNQESPPIKLKWFI